MVGTPSLVGIDKIRELIQVTYICNKTSQIRVACAHNLKSRTSLIRARIYFSFLSSASFSFTLSFSTSESEEKDTTEK